MRLKNPEKVQEAIQYTGYSRRGFARKIKISEVTLGKVLDGQHEVLPQTARKVASGLGDEIKTIFFADSVGKS